MILRGRHCRSVTCLVYERRVYSQCLVVHMYRVYSGLGTYSKGTSSGLTTQGCCFVHRMFSSVQTCGRSRPVIEPGMFSLKLSTLPFYLLVINTIHTLTPLNVVDLLSVIHKAHWSESWHEAQIVSMFVYYSGLYAGDAGVAVVYIMYERGNWTAVGWLDVSTLSCYILPGFPIAGVSLWSWEVWVRCFQTTLVPIPWAGSARGERERSSSGWTYRGFSTRRCTKWGGVVGFQW